MTALATPAHKPHQKASLLKRIKRNKLFLFMLLPGFLFYVVFHYIPMYGILIAFEDFKLKMGVTGSPWVGLLHFHKLFKNPYFYTVLKNTLAISVTKLLFTFPAPIIFALLLNELRSTAYKRVIQTISYLPNFISWVILSGIFHTMFSLEGPVNAIGSLFGITPKIFLADGTSFFWMLIITEIYKGFGWGSIIYMATITGIDPQLYEAASVDGATRLQKAIYITLPGLVPVITINLVFSVSGILNAGFDQIFNMYNPSVYDVADVIDTWVYRMGIIDRKYDTSTALGLFKSFIAILLILLTNKMGEIINKEKYTIW